MKEKKNLRRRLPYPLLLIALAFPAACGGMEQEQDLVDTDLEAEEIVDVLAEASISDYDFFDFLPLRERKAGKVYIDGGFAISWVMNPGWGASNEYQVQFRTPGNNSTWSSDIWEYREHGPLDMPFLYLKSHVSRQHAGSSGLVDVEFKCRQLRAVMKREVAGKWYVNDISEPGVIGVPYARRHWRVALNGHTRYIIQNWYHVLKHNSDEPGRYWFHQQIFVHKRGQVVIGPEWSGGAPAGREVLLLSEAMWEKNLATGETRWTLGSGEVGPDGIPTGDQVVYGRTRAHAYKTDHESAVMAFYARDKRVNGGLPWGTKSTWTY